MVFYILISTKSPLFAGIQIVQQIITPTGEIHQIPIQLNAQQLQVPGLNLYKFYLVQVIRAQMMGGAAGSQPIVIQTAPIQAQIAQPAQVIYYFFKFLNYVIFSRLVKRSSCRDSKCTYNSRSSGGRGAVCTFHILCYRLYVVDY